MILSITCSMHGPCEPYRTANTFPKTSVICSANGVHIQLLLHEELWGVEGGGVRQVYRTDLYLGDRDVAQFFLS